MSSEASSPSVLEYQPASAASEGVFNAACPKRFTCDAPVGTRCNSPILARWTPTLRGECPAHGDRLRDLDICDDIHDATVRIVEVHDEPAARFVESFDRSTGFGAEPLKVSTRRLKGQAEKRRLTELGGVHMMVGVGASHVQSGVGSGRGVHPE